MKPFFSPTSAYVRKARVTAIEEGLGGRIALVPRHVQDPAADLLAAWYKGYAQRPAMQARVPQVPPT
jgi:hypothetical protein